MSLNWKRLAVAAATAAAIGTAPAMAADPIRIALISGKTGPLEAYAKQTHTGLMMGLEYATQGTMELDGRKIEVIEKVVVHLEFLSKMVLVSTEPTREMCPVQ